MNDDPRLSALIKNGKDGDIVIVGCPYDFYRRRVLAKGGEQNGPCCLRRFYPKVGPLINCEYDIDISWLKVTDMGNIKIEISQEQQKQKYKNVQTKRFKGEYVNYQKQSPEKIIDNISHTLLSLIRNDQFPFIFGGSKESTLASCNSFYQAQPGSGQVILICGKPFLKRIFDGNKGTSDNIVTTIKHHHPKRQLLVFGPHIQYFPTQHIQIDPQTHQVVPKQKQFLKFITYQEIKSNSKDKQSVETGQTNQVAMKFRSIYPKQKSVHLSLSLQSIACFKGCRDINVQGIEPPEMCEIFFYLGQQKNLKSIDITQFNPSCQDYESSLIIMNIFYYFLMGRTKII